MVEQTNLIEQIKTVAKAREEQSLLSDLKKKRLAEWEERNAALLSDIADSSQFLADVEALLRETTIKVYQDTGNKAPAKGVGIREMTKLDYDPKEAFDWAVEHKVCLKLDTATFDKMSKLASETKPGFVKITTEPQATIATDLSKYITEVK